MTTSTHHHPAGGDLTLAVLIMADRCSSADITRAAAHAYGATTARIDRLNRVCRRRRRALERLVSALAEQASR